MKYFQKPTTSNSSEIDQIVAHNWIKPITGFTCIEALQKTLMDATHSYLTITSVPIRFNGKTSEEAARERLAGLMGTRRRTYIILAEFGSSFPRITRLRALLAESAEEVQRD